MSLTLEQVHHIADLARLDLTQAEAERYQEQLSAILAYFEQLADVDTEAIPPAASVSATHSVLREDLSRLGLALDDLLTNAPQAEQRQFRVPPVFDEPDA
jgi:aspartyl-tRNA(Asn)/glutamyl-tRNA(Gln) amidotransferase subunit C